MVYYITLNIFIIVNIHIWYYKIIERFLMEKKVKKEKDDIVENFNITSTGSLLTDITKIDIRLNQLPDS